MLKELIEKYSNSAPLELIASAFARSDKKVPSLKNISGSQLSFISYSLFQNQSSSILLIFPEKEEAAYCFNDLEQLASENEVMFFPASSQRLTAGDVQKTNIMDRTMVLKALSSSSKKRIVVSFTEAILENTTNSKNLNDNSLNLRKGEELSMDELIDFFNEIKFERTDFVYQPGQFSWRGGIIDVFSYTSEWPYRIVFVGDEIESIRTFDIESQESISNISRISIIPDLTKVEGQSASNILKFLPKESTVIFKDPELIEKHSEEILEKIDESEIADQLSHSQWQEIQDKSAEFNQILIGNTRPMENEFQVHFNSSPQPAFNKNFELMAEHLDKADDQGFKAYIAVSDANQVNRFHEIFEDIGKHVHLNPIVASFHEGYIDNDNKFLFYTDHQVFGRYHKFRLRESFENKKESISLKELMSLQPGDYITHIDHGVGKYSGLEKIDVNGKKQEAIRILYRNNDVLYISIHSLHRISKYVGKEGTEPKMDKLGSNTWKNLKQKTKKKVKELAFDLIRLYAERKAKEGFAFSPDSYLQTELEASFIYEDTPDQFKATQDVKKDMEASFPMDRLVCGDVGFGKTEIAIRSAFKAVNDSKQVAVLVPTTILAMQHYKTFSQRLEPFPCKIEYLNRFRTKKDETRILKEVAEGKVDIIIGTHKLLSEKVKFADLGLMIIDEEQKFGVGAKDKLKTIKVNVDTLTLTATPIPRTLQFSMMGARDLSVINTPPPNRLPIETHLYEFNEAVIREAIEYEVARGGQVFFIHNRVQNIGEVGEMVHRLCPEVKSLVAHGQMSGPELEKKMLAFINGEYDVLISTTIVESGLDIPNANTIIINQAHHFGLSDLHQMRGRVGRSNKKAFCFMLAPPLSSLTPHARKRLKAIEQFSGLGSGFQIAMRDLDIRGAGDIFGAEQSGFISEMGFDMYQKILAEAIQELKETSFKEAFAEEESKHFVRDCQIETDFEILIPDDYVSHIGERLTLYRELDELDKDEDLDRFQLRLEDRFGPIPSSTKSLFKTLKLRWLAKGLGMEKVVLKNGAMINYFNSNPEAQFYQSATFQQILRYVQQNPGKCRMTEKNDKLSLRFSHISDVDQAYETLEGILSKTLVN